MTEIGKHLATFNLFREPDGLYVTIADASGVRDELGESGAPLHLCAMNALRQALNTRTLPALTDEMRQKVADAIFRAMDIADGLTPQAAEAYADAAISVLREEKPHG